MEEICKPCTSEEREEYLEEIWTTLELDRITPQPGSRIPLAKLGNGKRLSSLIQGGDIRTESDQAVLTEQGHKKAREIIRNHRLAERLLHDVLNLQSDEMERSACHYEHMLDTESADSICILLCHPRTCPHGKYIPPGECCESGETALRPLVVPLTELDSGEAATVAYVGTRDNGRLSYLTSLGVVTGRSVQRVQKRPSFIVKVDENSVAFDESIAREIFVRPALRRRSRDRAGHRWRLRWGGGR
jgi:DtxR family transcriptional regulator, Mn-dependent transcriptional regulator